MTDQLYTTQLQAGLGMIDETYALLDLWQEGMSTTALYEVALESGRFPTMSARRLRNIVAECFAPRYLRNDAARATQLKLLLPILSRREVDQLFFLHTCHANAVLNDFVVDVYWGAYAAGRRTLASDDARRFVVQANQNGKTTKPWSEGTVRRVAAYVVGCCVDFGLLAKGAGRDYQILSYRAGPRVTLIQAHSLHFEGLGDNRVIGDPSWELLGMDRSGVLAELKRLAPQAALIVQAAGSAVRISWQCRTTEELANVLSEN